LEKLARPTNLQPATCNLQPQKVKESDVAGSVPPTLWSALTC